MPAKVRSAGAASAAGQAPAGAGRASWVGIAANPGSGLGRGRARVERLALALRRRGITPRIAWTLDDRARLIAESRVDTACRCLVAAGGDGTVSALLNERPSVPLTVLPAGTENLFARHFGIRSNPEAVAETIVSGEELTLDLGSAGGRSFALMAGLGFDADVVTRHHAARMSTAGRPRPTHRAAYVEPVLRSSWAYRFPSLAVHIEGDRPETLEGATVFLFNLPRYALGLPFAPTASAEDGLLDLVVFRKPGALNALRYLWLVLRGLHLKRPGVEYRQVHKATVEGLEPVPVQFDGDPAGIIDTTGGPWTFEAVGAAARVLIPRTRLIASA